MSKSIYSRVYETPYGTVSPKEARRILSESQNHRCCYCGIIMPDKDDDKEHPHRCTIEHIVPVSRGGQNDWQNIVAACGACNFSRGSRGVELHAIAWFYKIAADGAPKIHAKVPKIRATEASLNRMADNRAVVERQEEARRRWLAAIKGQEEARKADLNRRAGSLVARAASGDITAVFIPKEPRIARPNGKPKDCNFDPAQRKVALIKPPEKRMEPIPLEKMSKRHRRQMRIAAEAIAPMQTA